VARGEVLFDLGQTRLGLTALFNHRLLLLRTVLPRRIPLLCWRLTLRLLWLPILQFCAQHLAACTKFLWFSNQLRNSLLGATRPA